MVRSESFLGPVLAVSDTFAIHCPLRLRTYIPLSYTELRGLRTRKEGTGDAEIVKDGGPQ